MRSQCVLLSLTQLAARIEPWSLDALSEDRLTNSKLTDGR
jgi:hypothetical protein